MTRSRTLIAAAVVAAVLVGVLAWYLLRPAPGAVDLESAVDRLGAEEDADGRDDGADAAGDTPADDTPADDDGDGTGDDDADGAGADAGADQGAAHGDLDGTWTITTDATDFDVSETAGTFVGFRVEEELADVGATEAIGRTPAVTGDLQFDGTAVTDATIDADLTELVSDRPRRDGRVQSALETSSFPVARFELTEPIELDDAPELGSTFTATAIGNLTIRFHTVPVEVPLDGAVTDDGVLVVTGSFELDLNEIEVTVPSAPIVVSASDVATVELQLYLTR